MSRRAAVVLALVAALAACDRPAPPPPAPAPAPQPPLVDLNHATRAELVALPEIGDAYADRIIRGRPYDNKRQLVSRGIVTERMYDVIAPRVIAHQR